MRIFDFSAVSLSGLCLVHCLALPVLAPLSPLIGALADNELVHTVFVMAAVPVSAAALGPALLHDSGRRPWAIAVLAGIAFALLIAGILEWPSEAWETPLTVAGALLLAAVHLWNWRSYRHCHAATVGRSDGHARADSPRTASSTGPSE